MDRYEIIMHLKDRCNFFIIHAIDPLINLFNREGRYDTFDELQETRRKLYRSVIYRRKPKSLRELLYDLDKFRYYILQKIEEQMYGDIRRYT